MTLTILFLVILVGTAAFSLLVKFKYRLNDESLFRQKDFIKQSVITLTGATLLVLFLLDLLAVWVVYAITFVVILLQEYVFIVLDRKRLARRGPELRAQERQLEERKLREKWENMRAKGFLRFVLRYTAVCGLTLVAFLSLVVMVSREMQFSLWLAVSLALVLAAAISAIREWNWLERKYSGFEEPLK